MIDRYILCEWFKVFLLAMGATVGVLVLEDVQDDLSDFFDYGASVPEILGYYGWLLPGFLPTVIPLALLVSLLFTLGNLHRNNEIIALRAAGLSLFRLSRSLWLGGVLLAGAMLALNAYVVPLSIEQSRAIRENWRVTALSERLPEDRVAVIPNLAYDNRRDRRLWFFNRYSEYYEKGWGVQIEERDAQGRPSRRILANRATYDGVWTFYDGRVYTRYDAQEEEFLRSLPFAVREYPEMTEDPSLMKALRAEPADLTLFELDAALDKVPPAENPRMAAYAVRRQRILASPLSCLVIVGFAVPFAVSGVRVNPMVGVSKACGLFFAYYLFAGGIGLLGGQGQIPPPVAAWAPTVVALAAGLWLFKRTN